MSRFAGVGTKLLAKNAMYGLPTVLDLSDAKNCVYSYTLPEFISELIEMTCLTSLAREYVAALLTDKLTIGMELDLDPLVVKSGASDEFIFIFAKPYKDDVTGSADAFDSLQDNTVVWLYKAVVESVGGAAIEAGSNDRVGMPVTKAISGDILGYQTYNAAKNTTFGGDVIADNTAPAANKPTKYFVIETGTQAGVNGGNELTAGQWISYDPAANGGSGGWVSSGTWA